MKQISVNLWFFLLPIRWRSQKKKRVKYFIMNLNIDSDTLCNSLCFSSFQSHFIALAFSISQPNVLLIKIHELCTTFNVSFLRHLKKERLQLIINLKRALRVEYSKLELILGCALFRNYVRLPIFVSYRRKRGLIAGHNNGHEAHKYSEISFPRPTEMNSHRNGRVWADGRY